MVTVSGGPRGGWAVACVGNEQTTGYVVAFGGEQVAQQFDGPGRGVQVLRVDRRVGFPAGGGADDELVDCPVQVSGSPQVCWAADVEVEQGAFSGPRNGGYRVPGYERLPLLAGLGAHVDDVTGRGERPAGRVHDRSGVADLCGELLTGPRCAVVGVQERLGEVRRRGGEPVGDVEIAGKAPGRDEQPADAGGGLDLAGGDAGDLFEGVAGVVHGGDDEGQCRQAGHEVAGVAGGVGRADLGSPGGVGVGEAAGPQGEVPGFGGSLRDLAAGVGADVVPASGQGEPGGAGMVGGVGGLVKLGAERGPGPAGPVGEGAQDECAVPADDRAVAGGAAEGFAGERG